MGTKSLNRLIVAAAAAFALWAIRADAFDQYSTSRDAGNCADCHGNFRATDYIPNAAARQGVAWPAGLHDSHRNSAAQTPAGFLNGNCNACHSGAGRFPVLTNFSAGAAPFNAACSGCHNGDGLRAHHVLTGAVGPGDLAYCYDCHSEASAPPENTLPPVFTATVGPSSGQTRINDPCDTGAAGTVFEGSFFDVVTVGLDNDGDGLYDQNDPDCAAVATTTSSTTTTRPTTTSTTSSTTTTLPTTTSTTGSTSSSTTSSTTTVPPPTTSSTATTQPPTATSTTTTTLGPLVEHRQDALKLILKDTSGKGKAVWVSKVPPIVLPAADPAAVGATFRVKNPGTGETGTTPLPTAGWGTNAAGTLYKFVNKLAPTGPSLVKVSVVKTGSVLKVVAKDALISLDESSQGTVGVDLTIGSDRYCSTCSTALKDELGKYIAKGCPAPLACMSPSGAFLDLDYGCLMVQPIGCIHSR